MVLNSLFIFDANLEIQYRQLFGYRFAMYLQSGIGVRSSTIVLGNDTSSTSEVTLAEDMDITMASSVFPVRLGFDYNVSDDYALNLRYSLLVVSSSLIHSVQLGFGFPL